jgi:hypothetical protein
LAYIGTKPTIGNFQICDAISVVNGQAAYTMQVGGVNVSPQSSNHMIVSLNGTIQKPGGANPSFTVSGSTITFASNLATGDVIDFIQILGDVLDLGVPSDATVSTAKLADNAVTAAKITDSTITAAKLASGTVQNQSAFKNIIINGDMSQAQRGTSTSSITSDNTYPSCDRWKLRLTTLGTWTQSQSTTVPTGQGFATSLKMDCTTADASPAAGDRVFVKQAIEGQNLQYLKKGTSSAESTTVSFWVRSNKTGTYICEFYDEDNSRSISKSYTISSADTWEKKELTFAGDTTGAFGNDNGDSLGLHFWLGAGSTYSSGTLNTSWGSATNANRAVGQVNLADSTSNEWYVTGVQFEVGTAASDFEFLPVDVNLQRCQRYYLPISANNQYIANCFYYTSTNLKVHIEAPTNFRATPSISQSSASNWMTVYRNGAADQFSNSFVLDGTTSTRFFSIYADGGDVSGTGGQAGGLYSSTANELALEAEL